MCKSIQMYEKCIPEVFHAQIANISWAVANVPISLTIDETTEVHGDPAIGTFVTYYTDDAEKGRRSGLVDVIVYDDCNSAKIALIVNYVLQKLGKSWHDLVSKCSDSASYMTKAVNDLHAAQRDNFIHIKDPCHLIHAAVSHALSQPENRDMYEFVIKAGAVFEYAQNLKCIYSRGKVDRRKKYPRPVVVIRWFSLYEGAVRLLEIWHYFLALVNNEEATGSKVDQL
ncbi:hypothetical protein NDU88_002553 [Pleurodeles waltl]|uniref:Transposase n=1 Tax=Pleurodeles waltl TaxID=8319 RepID=A0AAV7MQX4_PLEWA|nr:hypothetical protein NDU88_002553 [Pleurodeles waltl]